MIFFPEIAHHSNVIDMEDEALKMLRNLHWDDHNGNSSPLNSLDILVANLTDDWLHFEFIEFK
jgi:hypothetical protein